MFGPKKALHPGDGDPNIVTDGTPQKARGGTPARGDVFDLAFALTN